MSHICCFSVAFWVPSETAWPFSWLFLSSEQGWHGLWGWSWGLLSILLQVTVSCSTRAPAPLGSPALLLQRRLMEKGQAQQLAAKNFLCFQPPPFFFFFFSFPLNPPVTVSHSARRGWRAPAPWQKVGPRPLAGGRQPCSCDPGGFFLLDTSRERGQRSSAPIPGRGHRTLAVWLGFMCKSV